MFQQSSSRNLHNKGSKFKRVLQIALLLAVVVWLVNHINKNESAGGDQFNLDQEEDVDFGRKGKAGSENVIIIDGQRNDFDEAPETSEVGDQDEAFGQHTEEKNEDDSFSKEQKESQEVVSNTGQTETQEEQLGNKDDGDDSSTDSRDVAIGNGKSNDKEDVLQLPSQRDSENSLDSNEGGNVEDNSVQQNEQVTLDVAKNDAGEAIDSDEEKHLSSMDQLESGETDEVEKEPIDSHGGVKSETESSSENSSEVEKEEIDPHGGVKSETEGSSESSLEDTTANASSDDASLPLPKEENGASTNNESSEKNTLESHRDISTDSETTEHHTSETISSDTKTEDEEKVSMMPTNNEVPKREAVEFQDNSTLEAEATGDNPSAEETNTESDDKLTVTSVADDTKNVELPVTDEALERDAVESHGDNASDAGRNDIEEEKMDLKSNEDALASKGDDNSKAQNSGDNSSLETSSETNSANEAENSSQNNENNLEIPTDEASSVEAAESHGDNFSKDENTSNTVFEDTTEPNPKEETTSELGNDNALSGDNDKADSSDEGSKEPE